ncbi:MAG: hypothetical protein HP002_10440 [Lentisphaeria bacterium]|nr:hypothetical protein [Lentisphaeria bacterium]MBS5530935.1 hypothetical protein [bacterium]
MEQKKITVLGIGGTGCRIVGILRENPLSAPLRLLAIDSDSAGLERSGLPEEARLLAGARWRAGRGCGGSVLDGQRVVAHERSRIEKLLEGVPFLLVIGGLGGGTASGGMPVVLSVARKLEIPTLFFVSLPFTLEGHSKRKIAEDTVKEELLGLADAVICLPNDLLFSVLESTTPLSNAFKLADQELSRTVLALTMVLLHGNLLAADFGNFITLLRRKKSFCSIGVGVASSEIDGESRGEAAMERLLHSPLLGGADKLGEADAVIFTLLGGPELSLGETKQLLELAGRQVKPETRLIVGAATGEEWAGKLMLSAVTVRFDAESEASELLRSSSERAPKRTRSAAAHAADADQLILPLEPISKGVMERGPQVKWGNDDLDVPTFKRRNITIDNGKRGVEQ